MPSASERRPAVETIHDGCPLSAIRYRCRCRCRIVASSRPCPSLTHRHCNLSGLQITSSTDYDHGACVRSFTSVETTTVYQSRKRGPTHAFGCCAIASAGLLLLPTLCADVRSFLFRLVAPSPSPLARCFFLLLVVVPRLQEGAERALRSVHDYRHHQRRTNPGHSSCPFIHRASAGDPPRGRLGGTDGVAHSSLPGELIKACPRAKDSGCTFAPRRPEVCARACYLRTPRCCFSSPVGPGVQCMPYIGYEECQSARVLECQSARREGPKECVCAPECSRCLQQRQPTHPGRSCRGATLPRRPLIGPAPLPLEPTEL